MPRHDRRHMAIVINHSGGKDSSAMCAYLRERYPDIKTYLIFADTAFEHVLHYTAEDWTRKVVSRHGLELNVVKNASGGYLDLVRRRGKFPSPRFRFCTSDTKRNPIEKFIRSLPEKVIINCLGIRAEESPSRAKMRPLTKNKKLCTRARTVYNWYPIHDWSLDKVLSYLSERDIPLHPVYVWAGGYLRRFSCRICIFMTDSEIRSVHQYDREAFNEISAIEREFNFSMKQGKFLDDIVADVLPSSVATEAQDLLDFGEPCEEFSQALA